MVVAFILFGVFVGKDCWVFELDVFEFVFFWLYVGGKFDLN